MHNKHSGKRFGRLLLKERVENTSTGHARYAYVCDCGSLGVANIRDIQSGRTQSCGCLHREKITSHNKARSPTYNVWSTMQQRCGNPNATGYSYYGGRGISVCERWKTFENFLADMGEQPARRMSIDRIDVNGNYEPGNCRWLSMTKQQLNRRNNRRITLGGLTQTVKEWCIDLKMSEELFRSRLKQGWTPEEVVTTPNQGQHSREHDPKTGRWKSSR